jgi:hypothetical protein
MPSALRKKHITKSNGGIFSKGLALGSQDAVIYGFKKKKKKKIVVIR